MQKIYLGSNSPRRLQLLQQLGLSVEVLSANIDETVLPQETATDYVLRMAQTKHQHIRQNFPSKREYPLLTADTCIAWQNTILGKPHSAAHAIAMLQQLSGQTHQVLTAIALSYQQQYEQHLQISEVTFKSLSEHEIAAYVATGEPLDKAGAYAIQGMAAIFIQHLSGSYSGVMGLPLFETNALLQKVGITILPDKN